MSAPEPPPATRRPRDGTVALGALVLVLAGLAVRAPVPRLPLDRSAAVLASAAAASPSGDPAAPAERPEAPLLVALVAAGTALGATPTASLRGLDLLLALLLAPLTAGLARRAGLGRPAAFVAGGFVAVHPLLVAHAGGALAGSGSLAAALLLLAWGGTSASRPGARRTGALAAGLLPLAEPLLLVHVPVLLATWVRRETSPRARALVPTVAVAALLLARVPALATFCAGGGIPGRAALLLLVLLPVAVLGLGLFVLPRGVRRLLGTAPARPWLLGAGLHLALLVLLPLTPTGPIEGRAAAAMAPLVPLAVLAAVAGGADLARRPRRRVGWTAAGLALAGSFFLAWGPLQTFLVPASPLAAGRLDRLGRALATARRAAGPGGPIALDDLGDGLGPVATRLADLAPGHPVLRLERPGAEDWRPALPLFSVDQVPARGSFAVLTRFRPWIHEVTTLGGEGIFLQEAVDRVGPWLVLRARRP